MILSHLLRLSLFDYMILRSSPSEALPEQKRTQQSMGDEVRKGKTLKVTLDECPTYEEPNAEPPCKLLCKTSTHLLLWCLLKRPAHIKQGSKKTHRLILHVHLPPSGSKQNLRQVLRKFRRQSINPPIPILSKRAQWTIEDELNHMRVRILQQSYSNRGVELP
jgi:hypothetical protein